MKQQGLLRVTGAPLMIVDRGIHMTIRHEKIFPAVVVIINKSGAPTEKWNGHFAQPSLKRKVGEVSFAIVVIENIRVVRKVRNFKIDSSIIVVIADCQAHAGLLAAVLIQRDA